ncbi:MAG: N-acetylglucosamine-6-phosphate deacetylase [Armatimonadetes bacterium]|nr:N-acetylglucosamine-6-phosphate deacetylase [Armatimonadota bacterium]
MTGKRSCLGPAGYGTYEVAFEDGALHLEPTGGPADGHLVPGFVDIHIHGYRGVDFMSGEAQGLKAMCDGLKEQGYEAFLATTVTAPSQAVKNAIQALETCDDPAIVGFHLEGPFLSPDYPGAQPQHAIIDFDGSSSEWSDVLGHKQLRVVTLAPERTGAIELVKRLSGAGVHASMGHTNATFEEAKAAVRAGVKGATHTYNAMRGLQHREPGTVGAVLTSDDVWAEFIYDQHHIAPAAADVLFRCKPADKVIAVSDGTAASGLPDGATLSMWGQDCVVRGGTVRLASNGALAGSAATLLDCFRNILADFGPELAIRSCCLNPRKVAGVPDSPRLWIDFDDKLDIRDIHPTKTLSGC